MEHLSEHENGTKIISFMSTMPSVTSIPEYAKGAGKVVCVDNFFLGKIENLSDSLKYKNFLIYRDDCRQFGVMQSIIEKEEIEVVFNMATIALNYSFFNPLDAYMVNVEIANTLLELLKIGAYKTLIHTSSSEAYGTS